MQPARQPRWYYAGCEKIQKAPEYALLLLINQDLMHLPGSRARTDETDSHLAELMLQARASLPPDEHCTVVCSYRGRVQPHLKAVSRSRHSKTRAFRSPFL